MPTTAFPNEQARGGQALIDASKPFAKEDRKASWRYVISTFSLLGVAIAAAILLPISWWMRLPISLLAGLLIVRAFILYHDYLHNAILRGSRVAHALFTLFGLYILTPATVWRQTHNYHHANTAKIVGSHVGSYAMMTTEMWRTATAAQRALYRIVRHPLTIALGYLTIFGYGMCLSAFRRNPRKNWDSLLALVLHGVLLTVLFRWTSWEVPVLGVIVPLAVACALGAYLFYAQHNFPELMLQPRERWDFVRAALESSSYMPMGPVMQWFTGNIGYHHVHHLNSGIPFYRLPEAMAAIPELQHPRVTTLTGKDIMACFKLDLWDPEQQRMIPFSDAWRPESPRS